MLLRLLCLLGLSLLPLSTWAELHRYWVSPDKGLESLSVQLCFDGRAPARLVSGADQSHQLISIEQTSPVKRRLRRQGNVIETGQLADNSCLRYVVDLNKVYNNRLLYRVNDSVLLSHEVWLWRPETWGKQNLLVNYDIPSDWIVSAPWQQQARNQYLLGNTSPWWSGRSAIGPFTEQKIEIGDKQLKVGLVGIKSSELLLRNQKWVRHAVDAVTAATGAFPLPHAHMLIVPIGLGGEPFPWAEVQRGGGPSVHYFIDQTRPLNEFMTDWTASHEISHLLHPPIDYDYKWIYEGIASYYQNVARARVGQLSHRTAWNKLYQGFRRGIAETDRTPLNRARGYMRQYWSGAAIMLMADVELRRRSNNKVSLDSVLGKFHQCCMDPGKRWGGRAFFVKLDQLAGMRVFTPLFDEYAFSAKFPDINPTLKRLGLVPAGERLNIDKDAELAWVREAIMRL